MNTNEKNHIMSCVLSVFYFGSCILSTGKAGTFSAVKVRYYERKRGDKNLNQY